MGNSFYSKEELKEIGLKSCGENVLISKKASLYSVEDIEIGSDVRIDDFCILSGKISIGNNIHIAAYSALFSGDVGIELEDFVGISSRTTIYAISDDYSGEFMTNPTVEDKYRNVIGKKVIMKKHSIIGASSVVLPGVTLYEGAAVGSCSLVNKDCKEWSINIGMPAKYLKERSKNIIKLELEFINNG